MPEGNVTISIDMPPRMRDTLAARFRRDTPGVHDGQAFNMYLCSLLHYALQTKPARVNAMQAKHQRSTIQKEDKPI